MPMKCSSSTKKTGQPATNPDGSYHKAKTAHTLNPVPLLLVDNVTGGRLGLKSIEKAGLSNLAARWPISWGWRNTWPGMIVCWKFAAGVAAASLPTGAPAPRTAGSQDPCRYERQIGIAPKLRLPTTLSVGRRALRDRREQLA